MGARKPSAAAAIVSLVLFVFLTAGSHAATAPLLQWEWILESRPARGVSNYDQLLDVTPTADGGAVAVGYVHSQNAVEELTHQAIAVRFDARGAEQWRKFLLPDVVYSQANRILPTADGGFVVGSGGAILRLDAGGAEQWRYTFDSLQFGGGEIADFDQAADGSILAGGSVYNPGGANGGSFSPAFAKLTPAGSLVWFAKSPYIGRGVSRLAATPDGGFFACFGAEFAVRYTSDGNLVWSRSVQGLDGQYIYEKFVSGLTVLPDGGFVMAGATREYGWLGYGSFRPFLVTFDGAGGQTDTLVVQTDSTATYAVTRLQDGGLLTVEGWSPADSGPFVVRYAPGGNVLWRSNYDRLVFGSNIASIREMPDGGFVAAGSIPSDAPNGGYKAYVLRTGAARPAAIVKIDVRPGNSRNQINARSREMLPVALLSSAGFDAPSVDLASIRLAGAPVARIAGRKFHAVRKDIDGDGRADLLLFFSTPALELSSEATSITMTGSLPGGGAFSASDAVRIIVPPVAGKKGR